MWAPRAAGRVVVFVLCGLVLLMTAWVCALGAIVILLSRHLGPAGALLTVAGGAVLLALIAIRAVGALRSQSRRPGLVERAVPVALVRIVMAAMSRPAALRLGLATAALALGLAAALLPLGRKNINKDGS
jgi:hypothetical protein